MKKHDYDVFARAVLSGLLGSALSTAQLRRIAQRLDQEPALSRRLSSTILAALDAIEVREAVTSRSMPVDFPVADVGKRLADALMDRGLSASAAAELLLQHSGPVSAWRPGKRQGVSAMAMDFAMAVPRDLALRVLRQVEKPTQGDPFMEQILRKVRGDDER